jgi:hypothetical protein
MANRRFIDFPIAASVGDNDIVLIWQDGMNKQTTKGTLIQGAPTSLEGLTDVDIAGLINGQILQYNSTTGKWENVDRTDINLSELGDVSIVSPTNGQVLVYNSSTSKWENSSGGYVPYTGAVTTVNLGAQSILAGSFVKAGGTSAQFLKADGSVDSTAYGTGSVTSVGITMPTAFSVANSPVTTAGTLAVTATGTTAQYIRGDGSLATFPGLTGFVPYTGATADVNLGTHDLAAERGTFANNGSSDTLTVNHTSGSGYGIIVTKGGNNEALYVSKTSGSGNAMTVVGGRTSLVDLALSSVTNTAGDFLTLSGGVVHKRTAAQTLTDIGGQAALTNPVTGTGTTNYLPKFTGSTTIGNSQIFDNGTNVGINTATPLSKLNILVDGAGSEDGLTVSVGSQGDGIKIVQRYLSNRVVATLGQSNYSGASDSGALRIYDVGGTETIRFSGKNGVASFITSGNLLIGTTTDGGARLNVNGSIRSLDVNAFIFNRAGNPTDTKNWYIQNLDTSGQLRIRAVNDAITDGQNALLISRSGASITNVSFPNGNLLVGTTTDAGFKLDVNGTGRFVSSLTSNSLNINTSTVFVKASIADALSATSVGSNYNPGILNIQNTNTTAGNLSLIGFQDASAFINLAAIGSINEVHSGSPNNVKGSLAFYTKPTGSGYITEKMRITSGGNVLIGTTTVGYGLFTQQRVNINPLQDGVLVGGLNQNFSAYTVQADNNTGTRYAMYIANGSSVGVGYISFTNTATSYVTLSDYRLKEDLKQVNGIEKINAINVYNYKWKNYNERMDGVLAHELAEILPYAVTGKKDGEQMQGVDYSKIVPLLIQSIKELKQEIDTLKN